MPQEPRPAGGDAYVGRRLGTYDLIERIGQGGMGAVYLAQRAGTGETVALKLVKRGMGTEAFLRRFHNERRILAAMSHPNIAVLLDAGTADDGLPYFVMEYVDGRPLNHYCDALKLPLEARLRLFQRVCAAVESAHRMHVIHRDIKPENILVTADGEPKLLDFGIAKILDGEEFTVSQQLTLTLSPVMTPRYASPEQARGERVTEASDIYSLGVLLYELGTGRSPYRPKNTSAHALVEAICHERPEPPSAAVRRAGREEAPARVVSGQRAADPEQLRRSLRSGLDGIVLKALQKQPNRRYASCAEFSADIERYLRGERVHARLRGARWGVPPWRWIAAAAALLAIAAGAFYWDQHQRLARNAISSATVSGFEGLFPDSVRRSPPESAEARRLYADALERLRTFDTLAARDLLRNAVTVAPEHALSHAALAAACSLMGYDTEARDEARKALELSKGLARQERLSIEGGYYETARAWDKAVEIFRTLSASFPENLEYGLRLANAQTHAGQGRAALETIPRLRALASGNDPRLDLAESEAALAVSDLARARDAAARAAQAATALGFGILAARAHSLESRIAVTMGEPQRALAAATQAQRLYQDAGHRQGVAWALNDSGAVLTQLGDVAGARARYEEALSVCRVIGDQICIGTDLDSIGVLRRRQGDLKGAIEMHEQALQVRRESSDRAGVAASLYNLGSVLEIIGDLPGARQAVSESLDLRGQMGEGRSAALTLSRLANIRRRQGELAEALRMNEQALAKLRSIGDRGGAAMALVNLGMALEDQGNLSRSRAVFEEALTIRRQQRDQNNTAQVLAALAVLNLEQDRIAEAHRQVQESISLRRQLGEAISLAQSKLVLADILLEEGDAAGAETAAREAAVTFQNAQARVLETTAHLTIARAHLARANASRAHESWSAADSLVRDSQEVSLLLARHTTRARIDALLGRRKEASALLDRALGEAHRFGLLGAQFEIRLVMAELRGTGAAALASEARRAGFLRIARKAAA